MGEHWHAPSWSAVMSCYCFTAPSFPNRFRPLRQEMEPYNKLMEVAKAYQPQMAANMGKLSLESMTEKNPKLKALMQQVGEKMVKRLSGMSKEEFHEKIMSVVSVVPSSHLHTLPFVHLILVRLPSTLDLSHQKSHQQGTEKAQGLCHYALTPSL